MSSSIKSRGRGKDKLVKILYLYENVQIFFIKLQKLNGNNSIGYAGGGYRRLG